MSDLFGNHIVGFSTRRLNFVTSTAFFSFPETTTSAAKDQNAHITIPVVVGVTIGVLIISAIAVTIFVKTSLLTKPHVKHPSYKYSNHTKPSSGRYLNSEGLRWQQYNFQEYLNHGYSGNNFHY